MNKFAQLTAACERSRGSAAQAKRLKANRGTPSRAAVSTVPGSKLRAKLRVPSAVNVTDLFTSIFVLKL